MYFAQKLAFLDPKNHLEQSVCEKDARLRKG
jgi:hypothetical protein